MKHFNIKIEKHIRILILTKKKVKPKGSAISNNFLLCNHSPSFESCSVLTRENRKIVIELKESLLTMKDKPS